MVTRSRILLSSPPTDIQKNLLYVAAFNLAAAGNFQVTYRMKNLTTMAFSDSCVGVGVQGGADTVIVNSAYQCQWASLAISSTALQNELRECCLAAFFTSGLAFEYFKMILKNFRLIFRFTIYNFHYFHSHRLLRRSFSCTGSSPLGMTLERVIYSIISGPKLRRQALGGFLIAEYYGH